ncbi:hyaluronoglucosaminidase [Streptomyces wuyuanensis]|uniref:hyaluronoglucosaminidase n=1 Tax=Streptomyces wuyuanensis TaxID=1196353 RepID=UPI003414D8E5
MPDPTPNTVYKGTFVADEVMVTALNRAGWFKTTSTTEHAMTVYQAGTTGTETCAINAISDNADNSAMWLTGKEKNRGTLKIAHVGYADGSDAAAAGLSIDLQTEGTASQGIFMTAGGGSGTTTGNMVTIRHNNRDDFVVKGTGKVAVRVPIGRVPNGSVEIGQGDDATPGLFIQANSASAQQLVLLRDSSGNNRFEVTASGAAVHRATSFFTSSVQVGATSLSVGGLNGAGIGLTNVTAAPSSNPSGGGVLYAEGGALKWRGPNGTVTTIAPA